jgi:hypothetical protein
MEISLTPKELRSYQKNKANVIYAGAGKAPINLNLAFRAKGKTIFVSTRPDDNRKARRDFTQSTAEMFFNCLKVFLCEYVAFLGTLRGLCIFS